MPSPSVTADASWLPAQSSSVTLAPATGLASLRRVTHTSELSRRFRIILEQLETGDYVAASEGMRHWADDGDLDAFPEEVVGRIRTCVMEARAELIHLEPDGARANIRQALLLTGGEA